MICPALTDTLLDSDVMILRIGELHGRTNVVGALQGSILLTVSLFDRTINGDVFEGWRLGQDLIPKLPAQSVVVMDNAAFHKRDATRELIAKAGHTLKFLPPYSPDLNPIKHK